MEGILNGFQFFGGLGTSLWTNVLSYVVLYVVKYFKSLNILGNFHYLWPLVMLPSISIGVMAIVDVYMERPDNVAYMYYAARLLSILFNFACYGQIAFRTAHIAISEREKAPSDIAISELSQRMIYYPLMQIFSRLAAAVYEPMYGFGPYKGNTGWLQFCCACFFSILTPSAGIGYLIIFLRFQPGAFNQLECLLCCNCKKCSCCVKNHTMDVEPGMRESLLKCSGSNIHDDDDDENTGSKMQNEDSLRLHFQSLDEEDLIDVINSGTHGASQRQKSTLSDSSFTQNGNGRVPHPSRSRYLEARIDRIFSDEGSRKDQRQGSSESLFEVSSQSVKSPGTPSVDRGNDLYLRVNSLDGGTPLMGLASPQNDESFARSARQSDDGESFFRSVLS